MVVALFIPGRPVFAQPLKSYVPPSPTAASLGIYGQIPISEYSGVPEIKVPLYTIQVNDFNLPVGLSYHSAGFRVSDEASWVGLGWSFNCGGVITRSKRHRDDFAANGYYQRAGNRPCGEDIDQEPDMFYYNIGSRSGKFIVDGPSGGNPYTIRQFVRENIKIEWDQPGSAWTLTTGEGVKYRFDKREYTTERTVEEPGGDTHTESYTSSWFVTSIELVDNSKILFSYLTPNTTRINRSFSASSSAKVISWKPEELAATCCQSALSAIQPLESYASSTTTVTTDEIILSQIDYPNGRIVLNTSARTDLPVVAGTGAGKKLDNVQVYTKQNGTLVYLKEFALAYDYYNSGSGNPPEKSTRLRLVSILERTKSATLKPYRFTYNTNSLSDKYGNGDFLGHAGLLQSIVYPTGGSTIFTFETHQAAFTFSPWLVTWSNAGARIQRIYSQDPDNKVNIQRFEYTGGKVMGKILWGLSFTMVNGFNITSECCTRPLPVSFAVQRRFSMSADFSSLGETTNGYIVGYDKVVTYYGENGENGKKESYFENAAPADPNYLQGFTPIPVPLNVSNKNGLLKDEYTYSNSGGTYVLLRQTRNNYTSVSAVNTRGMRFAYNKCNEWSYDITTEWVQHASQVVYNYDPGMINPVVVTTQYFYDDPNNALPTRIATTDSKGQDFVTTNYYAKEKSNQLGGIYAVMLNKNMVNKVIDQDKSRYGSLVRTATTYKDWYNNGKVIRPETEQSKKGNNNSEVGVRYHGYDEQGNVLALSKENGKTVSYVWGYNNTYPIAEVNNADYLPKNELITQPHNVGRFLDLTSTAYTDFETFTTNYGQTYSFSVRVVFIGTGTLSGSAYLKLTDENGRTLFSKAYYSANTYNETVTLPPGTGIYHFSASQSSPSSGMTNIRVDVTSDYVINRIHQNVFHTSFEELATNFTAGGKTGKKCITGPYSVIMPWNTGKYVLSWWEKPAYSGSWTYKEQVLNITTTNSPDHTLGNNTTLIDEVRVYPFNTHMATYTYEPGVGMTSKCDERNRIIYYEYDNLNRLKLIRDHELNIIKTFEYNYKN